MPLLGTAQWEGAVSRMIRKPGDRPGGGELEGLRGLSSEVYG
ncbi:hypothetical protein DBT_1075 [Dissulfuribacter thermophilus]|uniref:Uncharacterized protein n=1 Tax=Dissulfuribacter thermophilus TaxID=1156395 RepID=A0A1B9F5V3_9BACT|nr:hypothetical protein DBT_1075 [Dissulfuribacter thermophilus]